MEMSFTLTERNGFMVCLWLHTPRDPEPELWDAACAEIARFKAQTPNALQILRMLVITDGGAPTLTPRAVLNAGLCQNRPVRAAALTTALANPIKRGLVKALTWTNPAFKATGPGQWADALAHLDLAGEVDLLQEAFLKEATLSAPL